MNQTPLLNNGSLAATGLLITWGATSPEHLQVNDRVGGCDPGRVVLVFFGNAWLKNSTKPGAVSLDEPALGAVAQSRSTLMSRSSLVFLYSIIGICLLPLLAMLVGLVDGSAESLYEGPVIEDAADVLSAQDFYALQGLLIHSFLSWSAVSAAFLLTFLTVSHYRVNRDIGVLALGALFLATGLLDTFHVLVANHLLDNIASDAFTRFTWATSRLFNALGLLVIVVCLVARKMPTPGIGKMHFIAVLNVVALLAAAAIIYMSLTYSHVVLQFAGLTRSSNISALLIFILAGILLLPVCRANANPFVVSGLIIAIPQAACQLYMVFGSKTLYDSYFNIAELMKLVAYLTPLVGLVWWFIRDQQDLKDSRQRHLSIVNTMVDGLITINVKGLIEDFNQAAEQMFGYRVDEVRGRNINMLMPEPYHSAHDKYLDDFRKTGIAKIIGIGREVVGKRKDGSTLSMYLSVGQMEVAGQVMYSGIVRDITRQKKVEETTRKNRETAEKLYALSAQFDLTLEQKMLAALQIGRDRFGMTEGAINRAEAGQCRFEYVLGSGALPAAGTVVDLAETYCSRVFAEGKPLALDDSNETVAHDEPCYLSFGQRSYIGTPLYVNGNVYGTLCFSSAEPKRERFSVTDLTIVQLIAEWTGNELTRDVTQAELSERTERIRNILETVVDGVITVNSHMIIESFNPAAEKMFGYRAEEAIGKDVRMLMPKPLADSDDIDILNHLLGRDGASTGAGQEVEGRRKFGSTFPMELTVSEMNLNGQRVFTGIMRDITERKKVDRLKNQFVSTVSHELRTPLTAIRGALGLVLGREKDTLSDRGIRLLETANRNSERLTYLINDILDLEKIDSGKLEFDMQPVDICTLTRRAVEENESYTRTLNVALKFDSDCCSTALMVKGDEQRLLQVYANLISNAAKYSPEHGTVVIKVSRLGDSARVSVLDNGSGIPEAFHSEIFSRFAQADSSDSRQKGGTGLGLAICKAIIDAHTGHINFRTLEGVGTEFYFELPCSQQALLSPARDSVLPRALICEDNRDVAEILIELLEDLGLSGDIAATGEMARTLLANNTYQLVLLDLILPDIDGLQLLKELRAQPETLNLPVIVVSSLSRERAVYGAEGTTLAVIDWVQKPIDTAHLASAVKQAMRQHDKPRVLHIEDNVDVITVTKELLGEMCDYDYATSLKAGRQKLCDGEYHLLILDLTLPDGQGADLLAACKDMPPTIIFSGYDTTRAITDQVVAALSKSNCSNEQLIATVRRVLDKEALLPGIE